MNNKIGEKIKSLRKKADITQEKLAEYLNITFQAVSRWESGICYPDLELLPSIANFFNVTTDELLGVDINIKKERIDKIHDLAQLNFAKGLIDENITLYRTAINEFPNDYSLLSSLAFYLGIREETKKESISIFERILSDCTEDKYRYHAIQFLAYRYKEIGENRKAIETAKKLSSLSSETLLSQIYEGDELIKHLELELLNNCDMVRRDLIFFAYEKYGDNDDTYCLRNRINIFKKAVAIFEIILEDCDYGFYNIRVQDLYMSIAFDYLHLNEYDKALDGLEKATRYAITYDTLPDVFEHTSLIFANHKFKKATDISKDHTYNSCYELISHMSNTKYDIIRETSRFKDITASLKKYTSME